MTTYANRNVKWMKLEWIKVVGSRGWETKTVGLRGLKRTNYDKVRCRH